MVNNLVLIIEDDKSIADYFKAVLVMAGMQVEVVLSAREGLLRLAGAVPALILLDLHLGMEISGRDIIYQIRSNPRLDSTKVIVVTGFPGTAQLIGDLADLILIKPVGIEQLTKLAQRMVSYNVVPKAFSFRDPITGLFNQEFFHTRLELAFERARRRPEFLFAVIAFQVAVDGQDADSVNQDVEATIAIQAEIAKRLKHNLRPTDTLSRVTEWKFISLYEDLRRNEDTQILIERIQNILAVPFQWCGAEYKMRMVCGTAVMRPGTQKAADILASAEHSLKQAIEAKANA